MKGLATITLLILVAGCSNKMQVFTDHDPDYKLDNFKTFDWGFKANIDTGNNTTPHNELTDKRIKSAILHALTSRGYAYTHEEPDRVVHYHVIVDAQSVVTLEPNGFYGAYRSRLRPHVYSYREGTLIIDLMDSQTGNLIWRGSATAVIDTMTSEQAEEAINHAVAKIFRKFPHSDKKFEDVVSKAH